MCHPTCSKHPSTSAHLQEGIRANGRNKRPLLETVVACEAAASHPRRVVIAGAHRPHHVCRQLKVLRGAVKYAAPPRVSAA